MQDLTAKMQMIADAFARLGSKMAVSNELNIPRTTVRENLRAAERAGYAPWLERMAIPDHLNVSKTTVHYKDGQVVQEWRRLEPRIESLQAIVEALCEQVKGKARVNTKKPSKAINDDVIAELSIYDAHIGMYADSRETNDEDYDCDIAAKRMVDTAAQLASRFQNPGHIIVTLGGDILHSDNRSNRTELSGNVLDVDSRFHRVVSYARHAVQDVVQIATSVAPKVTVVVLEGNHDWHSSVWLAQVLDAYFSDCQNVEVITQCSARKHMVFGNNLLVWSHGDGVRMADWQPIVAAEFAQQWGKTKFRHLKLGHIHHKKKNQPARVISETKNGWEEHRGLLVEYLPAMCVSDAWHASKGFIGSMRGATGYEYHKELGLVTRYYQHIV